MLQVQTGKAWGPADRKSKLKISSVSLVLGKDVASLYHLAGLAGLVAGAHPDSPDRAFPSANSSS